MARRLPLLAALLLLLGSLQGREAFSQAGAACDAASASAAFRANSLERLEAIYETSRVPRAGCPSKTPYCVGRLIAVAYRNHAIADADTKSDKDLQALLKRGRTYGSPWQILAAEGDLEFSRAIDGAKPAYARAALAYELAMNDLAEEPACAEFGEPGPPPRAQIAVLQGRMRDAKLLAPRFELVRTRDGQCGGIFLTNVRGFDVNSIPVPIEFETDSSEFTPKGQQGADALVECVMARNFPSIRLTGHADSRGPDDYNMRLSKRRLDAVEKLLVERGFKGRTILEPKGKRQPYKSADDGKYSPDDLLQLNRRVELAGATQ